MYQPEGVDTDSIGHLAVQKTQFFICGRVSVHLWRSSAFSPDLSCTAEQTVKPLICTCIMKHSPLSGRLSRTNSGRRTCTGFWCITVMILLLVFGHIHLRKCTVTGRKKGLQLFSVLVQLNLSLFFSVYKWFLFFFLAARFLLCEFFPTAFSVRWTRFTALESSQGKPLHYYRLKPSVMERW